jgi:probable F420-dependent oxidoreductase
VRLSGTGIWSAELRAAADRSDGAEAAAELEELGYSSLWLPGREPATAFDAVAAALRATRSVTVATGILSVWQHAPDRVAAERAQLADAYGGRFLLGLGISHAALVEQYRRPLATMRGYLEALDAAAPPVPRRDRVIAALGPRMLELARDRSAGSHPYLVPVEHTRVAREALGPDALLAPELGVVLERDADRARAVARGWLPRYLAMPNYTNNLRRLGFADADLADGGSDRLIDALIAWGDEEAIRARVAEHREAGADTVCVQVLRPDGATGLPLEEWRALAPALAG